MGFALKRWTIRLMTPDEASLPREYIDAGRNIVF
jgi:hypothetical protein